MRRGQLGRSVMKNVEPLERRMLLSLAPAGVEFRANSFTTGAQDTAAVASDADGDFVVAWSGNGSGDGNGVFAQRYNSSGVAQGTNFLVNTSTTFSQSDASVAMDADGDFVIAWENRMSGASSDYDIFAQRYNAAGVAQGGEFRVNTFSLSDQRDAAVAIDASGNFVITWMSFGQQSPNTRGIYAQRYNAAGVKQGGELHVNTLTTDNHRDPTVAMDADGDFAIVWASDASGITARRYSSAGASVGGEFNVNNSTTTNGSRPTVAMDASGDFVVIWNGTNIWARRFDANGAAQGLPFAAMTFTTGFPIFSSVAMDADGDFLVTGERDGPDGSSYGVFAQSFSAAGVPQDSEFRVNTFTTNRQRIPAVAMDADGDAVVAWQSLLQDSTNSYGVYAQRYDESKPDTAPPMVGGVFINGEAVRPGQRIETPVSSLALTFSEAMSVVGGTSGSNSASNRANYRLMRNGADISSQISFAFYAFDSASGKSQTGFSLPIGGLPNGTYALIARETLQDVAGNGLDGDFNGVSGGEYSRAFSIVQPVPVGPEFRVNSTTAQAQSDPAVAKDVNGNFVVTWGGNGPGDSNGIFAQRYNAAGVPQGGEFRANTHTTGSQFTPAIAMSFNGDFVITWESDDEGGRPVDARGIYAQRYSPGGVPLGGEFHVNVATTLHQTAPSIAMDNFGNFVIAWTSQDAATAHVDVFARRYDLAGVPQTSEFRVNSHTFDDQFASSVAMDGDGNFVVAWSGDGLGESDYGVFAQRYNAAAGPQGSEFHVNTYTFGPQEKPAVAMDALGNFVVTWHGLGPDADLAVRAQRYDSAGAPQGGEFRVNTGTSDTEDETAVAMDASGDFIITFTTAVIRDVFARRYNSAGVPQGKEFQVNTFTTSSQTAPAVAMDAFGDFVIAWESFNQDGSSYGTYAQRYGRPTEVTVSNYLFQSAPHRLQFTFNDDVSPSLGINDIVLQNLTTSTTIPSSALSLLYDTSTNTATFSYVGSAGGINGVLSDGNYRATFAAAGISNTDGTPLEANHVFDFFFLNGDADHDRSVDVTDLGILATNWQQSQRTFSQADFNYDGMVDVSDLGILATKWQTNLPATLASRALIGSSRHSSRLMNEIDELSVTPAKN